MSMYTHKKVAKGHAILREDLTIDESRQRKGYAKYVKPYRLIDLFCGAGGMSLGFSEYFGHSFKHVWANDFNLHCVNTYQNNFGPHCVHGDLVDILADKSTCIPKADVVIGGPPCQGFSLLNKKRDNDSRNQMWKPYLEVVRRSGAKVFVIENVPQLLKSPEMEEIIRTANQMGFKIWYDKLCSADYGVPQTRHRAVIVGSKLADPSLVFPPRKTHFNPKLKANKLDSYLDNPKPWMSVKDAIKDLPIPKGTEIREENQPLDLHFGRTPTEMSLKRYKAIPKEGMNRVDLLKNAPHLTPPCWINKKSGGTDLFGRLWWDRPAFTIRTEFFKPEKGRYLHPSQHRPITHREAARLQSFPDSFVFKGTKIEIARQIGNAVPPLMAARIADCVYELLSLADKDNYGYVQQKEKKLDYVAHQGARY